MKINFTIQYNEKGTGESVETTSCISDDAEGRAFLHKLLDEFLDHGFGEHAPKSDDEEVAAHFTVRGKPCAEHI